MEYLNQMEEIINNLGKEGLFTMIDAHQDVFSRPFLVKEYHKIEKTNKYIKKPI